LSTLQIFLIKMKKIFFPVAAFIALIFIASCSTKFQIAAPYKNITVVYGFLDQADTAHYIRIQKAFLDQSKSALVMSKLPDSSFYANLDVKIERIDASGNYHDSIHLNRVDLDAEGYVKQPGVFFYSPNYAYKFTNLLDPNYIYRLLITNLTTGEVDSSDAPVIVDNDKSIFTVDVIDNSRTNLNGINFSSSGPSNATFYIFGAYGSSSSTLPNPVAIVQGVLRFNWNDSNYVTKAITSHYYDYNMGYTTLDNGQIRYNPLNLDLYKGLFAGMGSAPQNTVRLIGVCDISIYLSTSDFVQYQNASAIQGLGLTGNDIEPVYTNIKGANTIGLYTSRAVKSGQITITPETVDSLIASPYLAPTRIVGTSY